MVNIALWPKKWLIAMIALIIATPLGILIVWNYGDAWGEWGEVGQWVPQQFWSAPLPDYNFTGWDSQTMASLGYIISAIVGIVAIVIVTYLLYLAVGKRGQQQSPK